MKYVFVLVALLLFSCGQPAFEVGACKEFKVGSICPDTQLEKNRMMIDRCVFRGNGYNTCTSNLSGLGCKNKIFVVCRETEDRFTSFNNEIEVIQDPSVIEQLKADEPVYSPAATDTASEADWYNEKEK